MKKKVKVVWLKPAKGNISIGRKLIAEELEKNDFKVEILECSGIKFFKVISHVLRSDFDVVVGTTHLGVVAGGITKLLKKKPFLVDFVDRFSLLKESTPTYLYPIMYVIILLEKIAIGIADAIMVVPGEDYEKFSRERDNVYKVNLCVDLERFLHVGEKTIEKAKKILNMLGIDLNKPIAVYVGGFTKIYNLDLLIEAMEYLPDFQLVMIGGGGLENELRTMRKMKNLKNVFFLGYQPNDLVAGFLKLCDVGISLCEISRQLKIYEYLATGLKVVVPEKIMADVDFEFEEYCIGTSLNPEDIARKIEYAASMPDVDNRKLYKILKKYNCKNVTLKYAYALKSILD